MILMKKKLLLWILLIPGWCLQAQVVMQVQPPPLGLTIKPQLWNLSLINTGNETMQVRIELVMTDVSNNQRVLTGTSNLLLLPKGVKQLQHNQVMPVTYNYGSPGYSLNTSAEGFLPVGVFNICYQVIKFNSDAPERIAEECITQEVEPVSPPQLMLPANEEQVAVTRPYFAWAPPSPFNAYSSLLYDWVLVEVQPTQSAADALQQNIPVLTRQNITNTGWQYPLSAPELDTSKRYAWRITAKNNSSPIANSETWVFKITKQQPDTARSESATYFAVLKKQDDAAFSICRGLLRFAWSNEHNLHAAEIKIFDISSASRRPVATDSSAYTIRYGQNFMQVDLRNISGMIDRHLYLMELTDGRKEKWYLRFEYRK
jgi:hypothetical protein